MKRTLVGILSLAYALSGAYAQTPVPSAEQMVQQLKSPVRTRSLRNLNVETASGSEEQASVKPSLSLLIQFDFNSAHVSAHSQQALATLSQALLSADLAGSRFAVEGHTDAKGGADYNLKLSAQRAQAVVHILKSRGVKEERLVATGKGDTDLAHPDDPFAAENRRVRIVNLD